jgi:DNA-binding NarL/FixJ family response regulator
MKGKRVLVIANDPTIVWDIGQIMIENGFSVTATTSGDDGFQQLERNKFDYLVLDGSVQEVSLSVYLAYHQRYFRDTKIIVLGDQSLLPQQEATSLAGTLCFTPKPINPEVINDLVSKVTSNSNFVGVMSKTSLIDYIEYVIDNMQRKVLKLSSKSGEEGKIYIDQGNVVYAECSEKRGEEAFYHCLSFPGGNFWELPWEEPPERITQAIN